MSEHDIKFCISAGITLCLSGAYLYRLLVDLPSQKFYSFMRSYRSLLRTNNPSDVYNVAIQLKDFPGFGRFSDELETAIRDIQMEMYRRETRNGSFIGDFEQFLLKKGQ